MLPRELDGVVDANLRVGLELLNANLIRADSAYFQVYETKNLRVIDLSVVPLHIAAHPQCMLQT